MKSSTCFKRSYFLIVSYSRTVSNYFESKSDSYSQLITVGLIYLDKNKSNRKSMNRNWSIQKANPALKTKTGNK